MKINTKCVHSGTYVDPITKGLNSPIFTSSVYQYLESNERPYPRYFNIPNQRAVVTKLADLEQCEDGVLFSSGMAAISTTLLAFLKSGDHAVIQDAIYGGAHAFVTDILSSHGIDFTFAGADAESIIGCINPKTKMVYIESPTNPLLQIIDIQKVADACASKGIPTAIDNTFASPINQMPAKLGIDILIHSGTKYLGGHSDLSCGAALASKKNIATIAKTAIGLGGCLDAQSCYLLERSLKTLALRVNRQTENAAIIAQFLSKHPRVQKVHYPGLPDFEGYQIARGQMSGFGAMLSFEIKDYTGPAADFMKKLRLVNAALSLGGVETTICDPATTSHRTVSKEIRKRLGISDGLLRLSVGIEDSEDLIEDLSNALSFL